MSEEKRPSPEQQREDILHNLSEDGIKEALKRELEAANENLEFCKKKVEVIEKSIERFE